jgi:hypothetical protein
MAAFWLSLAFFTKMTALVLAVPMLAVLFYEYRGSWWSRAKIVLTSCAIYLPLPALWMIWNQFHHGMLLPVRADVLPSGYRLEENPLSESMLTFLSGHPVLEHFFINFIGMFGFGGTGGGSLKVLQVVSWQLGVYSLLALGLAVAVFAFLVLWLKRCIESPSGAGSSSVADRVVMACRPLTSRRIFFWLSLLAAVLSAVFVATQMGKTATPGGELRMVFYGFLTALLVLAVASRLKPGGEQLGVVAYAVLIMSFFMAVFLYQLWGVYLQDGRMRATQGRYLFPLIPLMLLAAYIPLVHFFKKRKAGLVVALALIMSLLEASVYLTQAFPFYEKGLA